MRPAARGRASGKIEPFKKRVALVLNEGAWESALPAEGSGRSGDAQLAARTLACCPMPAEIFSLTWAGNFFREEGADGGEGGGHESEDFADERVGVTEAGLFRDGGPVAGADDGLLDLSVVQRLGGDFFHAGRRFVLGQRLHGAHAIAADGGGRWKAARESVPQRLWRRLRMGSLSAGDGRRREDFTPSRGRRPEGMLATVTALGGGRLTL